MSTAHGTIVTVPDDGVSLVGSDDWNAVHNTSISSTATVEEVDRVVYGGTERLIAAGAGRMFLREPLRPIRGAFSLGTFDVYNDNWLLQYKRATLVPGARVTLAGNAELFLFDLAPVGRLILAGRGL